MIINEKIFFLINGIAGRSKAVDILIVFFASYLQYVLAVLFFVFLFSSVLKGRRIREILIVSATSVFASALIASIIKYLLRTPRPFVTHGVNQLIFETAPSFPSTHATVFIALAAAVYVYDKKWGAWFIAAGLVIGLSRVAAGVHYPVDIIGGIIIGSIISYTVFKILTKKELKSP